MTLEMHVHDCIATNKTVLIISPDVVFFLLQLSRIRDKSICQFGDTMDFGLKHNHLKGLFQKIISGTKVNSC